MTSNEVLRYCCHSSFLISVSLEDNLFENEVLDEAASMSSIVAKDDLIDRVLLNGTKLVEWFCLHI